MAPMQNELDEATKKLDKLEKQVKRMDRKLFYLLIVIPLYVAAASIVIGVTFKMVLDVFAKVM
jgi:hypothetical protein